MDIEPEFFSIGQVVRFGEGALDYGTIKLLGAYSKDGKAMLSAWQWNATHCLIDNQWYVLEQCTPWEDYD